MESATIDARNRQRGEALAHANRVRIARAVLKRRIADGRVSAAEVILLHPWEAESMPVADVLVSQRSWGDVRCRRMLVAEGLSASKPIGSLTERQRLVLAARLTAPASLEPTARGWEGNGAQR